MNTKCRILFGFVSLLFLMSIGLNFYLYKKSPINISQNDVELCKQMIYERINKKSQPLNSEMVEEKVGSQASVEILAGEIENEQDPGKQQEMLKQLQESLPNE